MLKCETPLSSDTSTGIAKSIGLGVGGSPSADVSIADSALFIEWKYTAQSSSNSLLGLGYNF